MGYSHNWDCKVDEFTEEFLQDVETVILEHAYLLQDVHITDECIYFNGSKEHGCETFCLETGRSNWCKTNVNTYDKVVTPVLLLALYHFKEKISISSSGMFTVYSNPKTKEVGGYFEESLTYIEDTFGYRFEKEVKIDEYGQKNIDFIPLESKRKEIKDTHDAAYEKLLESYQTMGILIQNLKKNPNEEIAQILYKLVEMDTQNVDVYLQILRFEENESKQKEISNTHEIILERISEIYTKMESCIKRLEETLSEEELEMTRNTIRIYTEFIQKNIQLLKK